MSQQDTIQVTAPLYLLTSTADCWKCGNYQPVVALATRHLAEPGLDADEQCPDDEEPMLLNNIQALPTAILDYIRSVHPRFEKRTSRTIGSAYYMNTCACGAHFGDHFLFSEPGGAFFPDTEEEASGIIIEELHFQGTFDFVAGYSMGMGAFIFEHGHMRDRS